MPLRRIPSQDRRGAHRQAGTSAGSTSGVAPPPFSADWHTLSEVDRVADRVAILRAGRLVVIDALDRLRAVAVRRWELDSARPPVVDGFRALAGVREA